MERLPLTTIALYSLKAEKYKRLVIGCQEGFVIKYITVNYWQENLVYSSQHELDILQSYKSNENVYQLLHLYLE